MYTITATMVIRNGPSSASQHELLYGRYNSMRQAVSAASLAREQGFFNIFIRKLNHEQIKPNAPQPIAPAAQTSASAGTEHSPTQHGALPT